MAGIALSGGSYPLSGGGGSDDDDDTGIIYCLPWITPLALIQVCSHRQA